MKILKSAEKRRHTLPSKKHNTPNNAYKSDCKRDLINYDDLRGFQFSPEVLEESVKTEISQRQYEQVNKVIKEFCDENHVTYDQIPFEKKIIALKGNLNSIKIDWREGYSTLEINRETVLEDSMKNFYLINPFKELKINFLGEVSHDAGGLIREWFTIIFRQILSSKLNLFIRSDCDNFSYKINPILEPNEINLKYFKFIGILLAKALLENVTINTCFTILIYKMMLNEKIRMQHLMFYDQPVINFKLNYFTF